MAVVDVYDAVHTRTLYSSPLSADGAEKLIAKGRGTHFDPDVVDAFTAIAPLFLSNCAQTDASFARDGDEYDPRWSRVRAR